MSQGDEQIESLREALKVSPNNVPLRRLLGDALLAQEAFAEAEAEYRRALKVEPGRAGSLESLARCYHAQGKNSAALVVLEELMAKPAVPAAAHALQARVLLATGQAQLAAAAYRRALELDPRTADPDLAERLGMDSTAAGGEVVDGRLRAQVDEALDGDVLVPLERPAADFASVGGMEAVKEEIRMKIIFPLTNQDLYAAYGKRIGGGILLYGPPGCGKTHLARATAGEIKAGFLSVGLHEVLDMWIGQSEQKLHQIFEQARRNAPSVLFFDEVDALAASRTDMRRSAGRHLINQFLAELDGVGASNEGVLVLAATNAPWHVDSAFRRPGRFDRILFVPPPDTTARAAILHILLAGKPLAAVDYAKLAQKTEDFSGADFEADAIDHGCFAIIQDMDIFDLEYCRARMRFRLIDLENDVATNHHFRQAGFGSF